MKKVYKKRNIKFRVNQMCGDVTNSRLDDKLPFTGLWLVLVEVKLSKERIQNYSLFLISRKMELREL